MTNEAISAILEHLCNEARNAVHATLGVMEVIREGVGDPSIQASAAIGRASADQLLSSLDDVRDLFSTSVSVAEATEQFDLVASIGEIVEMLNLASGRRSKRMTLDGSFDPIAMAQDRRAVEQAMTRILDTAFKMTETSVVRVKVSSTAAKNHAQITIAARDGGMAARLVKWLTASPDQAIFENPDEVPVEVALMVAGKHLGVLGGSVELVRDSAGHTEVVLTLPRQAPGSAQEPVSTLSTQSDALNVLVAEDCDDSFALSELMFQQEHLWRARDGREALRMIQKQRFDLVFMDVHMPGMDGYAAIRGMREWETQTGNARTPILILSSDDLETQRRSAAQCGCSGFLRKPLRAGDVKNLLERLRHARTLVA